MYSKLYVAVALSIIALAITPPLLNSIEVVKFVVLSSVWLLRKFRITEEKMFKCQIFLE